MRYEFHPLRLAEWLRIKVPVAEAALKSIRETLVLLEQPNVWIQGEYEKINREPNNGKPDENGNYSETIPWQGCLIGAIQKIGGEGELLAASILTSVITGCTHLDKDLVPWSCQRSELYNNADTEYYFFDGANEPEHVEGFNDDPDTNFADIRKFLEFSIVEAERVVTFAKAGLGFPVD